VLARACVAVIALAVLAWLGIMERNVRLEARGAAAVRPGAPVDGLEAAETDLRRARLLNPDAQPDIDLALVYRARGEAARASAAIEDVVRREPDNRVAWGVAFVLARGRDQEASARALAALRRLDPLNARRAPRAPP
jgi:cytochrome c-type biogenesis protein CcmH/NrfG